MSACPVAAPSGCSSRKSANRESWTRFQRSMSSAPRGGRDRGHRHRQRRAAPCESQDIAADPLSADLAKQLRMGKSGMIEAGGKKLFLNVYAPTAKLVIIGAVHISQALAPLARSLDYDVTVVDPRTAFASPERFPDVPLIAEWPDVALPPLNVDHYTAFVAVTHDPKIDDPALLHAFRARLLLYRVLWARGRPRQARRSPQGARRKGCRYRAHSRADRSQHRRGVAIGNRGRDHGRDHRAIAIA